MRLQPLAAGVSAMAMTALLRTGPSQATSPLNWPDGNAAMACYCAFAGRFHGTLTSLDRVDGGIRLSSEQIAVGRTPWTRSVDLRFEDGAPTVFALSYGTYDRPMGGGFSCTVAETAWWVSAERVNPETGQIVSAVSSSGDLAAPLPLPDAFSPLPTPCAEALNDWLTAAP